MRVAFYVKAIVSRLWLYALLIPGLMCAQTPTTTALVSSPNPAYLGQAVTLTATITPGATGEVTFYEGTTILGITSVSGVQTTVLMPSRARLLRAYSGGSIALTEGYHDGINYSSDENRR